MTMPSSETVAWARGFFRVWVLLSIVWIGGAILVVTHPPVQIGPPQFDETMPFLKITPSGKFMKSLAECRAEAKLDPGVDLQNCAEYFEAERVQQLWRFVRPTGWVVAPPLVLLFFGAAIGWALRGFRRVSEPI
jgi:hypothetical protein